MESTLRFLNKTPLFSIKLFAKTNSRRRNIERVVSTLLVLVFYASLVPYLRFFHDLESFLVFANMLVHEILPLTVLWSVWTDDSPTFDDFKEINAQLDIKHAIDDSDLKLYAWLIFQTISHLFLVSYFVTFFGILFVVIMILPMMTIWSFVPQVFLLKYLLVVRLDIAVNKDEDDLTKIMPLIRHLMKINERINDFFSTNLGIASICTLSLSIWNIGDIWMLFALGNKVAPTWLKLSHTVTALLRSIDMVLVATMSSAVADKIGDLSHRMDRKFSLELGPRDPNRKKLVLAIGELDHMETELSGMGLFSIGTYSVFSYLGFILNIFFVFVEFL